MAAHNDATENVIDDLASASAERERLVGWLARRSTRNDGVTRLAERLLACTPRSPCRSGACPECLAVAQRDLAHLSFDFAGRMENAGHSVVYAIVMPPASAVETLRELDLERVIENMTGAFTMQTVMKAVFAVNFGVHEHASGAYESFFVPHVHALIASDEDVTIVGTELRASFPGTDAIPRPVCAGPWDGAATSCASLLQRSCRQYRDLDDDIVWDRDSGEARALHEGRWERLPPKRRIELLSFLDQIGIDRRISWKE